MKSFYIQGWAKDESGGEEAEQAPSSRAHVFPGLLLPLQGAASTSRGAIYLGRGGDEEPGGRKSTAPLSLLVPDIPHSGSWLGLSLTVFLLAS